MNRDFIFRAANQINGLNYLGYVINVGSPKELIKAVSELGFNANVMEYKKVPLSSKAIAVCLYMKNKRLVKILEISLKK